MTQELDPRLQALLQKHVDINDPKRDELEAAGDDLTTVTEVRHRAKPGDGFDAIPRDIAEVETAYAAQYRVSRLPGGAGLVFAHDTEIESIMFDAHTASFEDALSQIGWEYLGWERTPPKRVLQ